MGLKPETLKKQCHYQRGLLQMGESHSLQPANHLPALLSIDDVKVNTFMSLSALIPADSSVRGSRCGQGGGRSVIAA